MSNTGFVRIRGLAQNLHVVVTELMSATTLSFHVVVCALSLSKAPFSSSPCENDGGRNFTLGNFYHFTFPCPTPGNWKETLSIYTILVDSQAQFTEFQLAIGICIAHTLKYA